MTDFSLMQAFVLTSDLGSLAAVARKIGISPAAISKQLTKLENELGLQLLLRSTRRIEHTEVGKNYYYQCKRVLEEVEAASDLISKVKAKPQGILKIVSGRHFANTYITPHTAEFLLKFPEIEFHLELAERIPDLNLESIDVLIGMSISATGDAIQKRIATTSYSLCASPAYLEQFGTPKKPDDLKNHRYITHSMRKPNDELSFDKKILSLKPYIYINDTQTMLEFALAGLGIVNLHHYVVKKYLELGTLKKLLSNYVTPEVPLFVAYPQRRFVSSKVRCFIDFISEKLVQ